MCFVTKAMPMNRKLHYISKCNELVQLVVQVKYHVNVFIVLGVDTCTHRHTNFTDKNNFKKPGAHRHMPGLKIETRYTVNTYISIQSLILYST